VDIKIFTPTIHHSGSNFIRKCVDVPYVKMQPDGPKVPFNQATHQQITAHFIAYSDSYMPGYIKLASRPDVKTVIPLRHPAMIAVSHKKRDSSAGTGFLYKWFLMCQIPNAFYFPIETMPFDELEDFLGRKVNRSTKPLKTLGDYPEKESLEAARKFLKDDWWAVEAALNTDVGQKYYGVG
jgi:hypothetical protein